MSAAVEHRARGAPSSLLALALSIAHFASFDVARQPLVTDVRYYVYLAWRAAEGVPPHVSAFDPKTQLATFAGALFLRIGEVLGADPLVAMRAGFLGIAALGGWLSFLLFRRLSGGSAAGGFLGLFAYCGYGLIGALPAIGPVPKLSMAVCTTGAALLVHSRRWTAAGAVATLAFLDWQIGAATCVAVLASALAFGAPRGRAAARVLAGGALAASPYVAYFAWKGALGAAFEQTVVSAFFRGSAAMQRRSFAEHVEWIASWTRLDLPEQLHLVPLGLAGVVAALALAALLRRDDRLSLLLPALLVHLAVLAFSLVDFQGHGDLSVLLHGLAFFQGCLWAGALLLARRWLAGRARAAAATLLLVAALAAARPSFLRPELHVSSPFVAPGGTLDDQRAVARELERRVAGRTFGVLESSEYLWFLRRVNPLPAIYWNPATFAYFRSSPEETEAAVLARLIRDARLDAILMHGVHLRRAFGPPWRSEVLRSENGAALIQLELYEP